MKTAWKSPNTIIGSVARGQYYYERTEIVNDIWIELEKGNYILIAAPRRVGKTSVMNHITETSREGFKQIFNNVQGVKSENEFYEILYRLILSCLTKSIQAKKWFGNYIKSKTITEIDINGGVKFSNTEIDYLKEINDIIPKIEQDGEIVVLLIDELPEVLFNLNKKGKTEEAMSILKNLRRWRQGIEYQKLRFVLAGSIGIHYVVSAIEGRTSDLNDLKTVYCNPLELNETNYYFDWATKNATIQYSEQLRKYLLDKILYFVPYFFNIMFDEIDNNARRAGNTTITEYDIDVAFNSVIRKNDHFADWKKRLKNYMPKEDFEFVNDILTHIAHKGDISIQDIYNKAQKHNKSLDYMDFIFDLRHDGYISENEQKYTFISPFLKEFWKQNNPIYNE